MSKKVAFYTLGCKVNQYDTAAMAELFEQAGYEQVAFEEVADLYVVNTCSVTQMSDKKSRQMISRAHFLAPKAKIIVTGCYAQRAPEELLALPGVTVVSGTKRHARILEAAEQDVPANLVEDIRQERVFEAACVTKEARTRAYLKIQDGCNRYCTYCIIPYTRGPIRSRPLLSVREEMETLAREGYCEIVLTGIHLMSYGQDFQDGTSLLHAIRQAEGIPGLRRIRLGSLEPQLLSPAAVEELARNPRICRQFHLSLQSGSNQVLSRMNRRYTAEEYAQCVEQLRKWMPDCTITTDVIAGFPGETEAEFEETLAFARAMGFFRIHAFPYSRRTGTKAAQMSGQVPNRVKTQRTRRLILLGEALEREALERMCGSTGQVLAEEQGEDGILEGYTGNYARVRFPGEGSLLGSIVAVKLLERENGKLLGKMI